MTPQHLPQTTDQDGTDPDITAESKPTGDAKHGNALGEQLDPPAREPVLMRGMRILEAFTDTAEPLKLSQIKERSDLPLTTTHRLVGALVAAGALEEVGPRRYQVGTRLIAVVNAGYPPVHCPVS